MKLRIDKDNWITRPDPSNYCLMRMSYDSNRRTGEETATPKLIGYYSSPIGALKRYVHDSMEDVTEVNQIIAHVEQVVANITITEEK